MTGQSRLATPESIRDGHEPVAARGWMVTLWTVALLLLIAASLGLTWQLRVWLQPPARETAERLTAPAVPTEPTRRVRLNPDQEATRQAWLREQQKLLAEYAWQDRDAGIARIPVERALEILAESNEESP